MRVRPYIKSCFTRYNVMIKSANIKNITKVQAYIEKILKNSNKTSQQRKVYVHGATKCEISAIIINNCRLATVEIRLVRRGDGAGDWGKYRAHLHQGMCGYVRLSSTVSTLKLFDRIELRLQISQHDFDVF